MKPITSAVHFGVKTISLTFFFWIVLIHRTSAQTFSIDTASFFNETDNTGTSITQPEEIKAGISKKSVTSGPNADVLDEPDLDNISSEEMMFIPSDVLYANKWDTLNIRIGRADWSKIPDSSLIVFNDISKSNFVFPYKGKVISPYGWRGGRIHAGVDIKLSHGDTIVSAFDGKVRIARSISGYGKLIVVRHNNGLETVYGHLSKYLVRVNDEVKAGEPIGLGGRTGRASTDHLHFETRILGDHFNPDKIIDFDTYCLKNDCLAMDKDNLGFGTKESAITSSNKSSDEGSKYVKIKPGDTLYALARKHKTSVDRICRMNGISPKKILSVGSRIRVD